MSRHLTKLQRRLCNILQDGLPVCPEPFADLAKFLNTDEKTLLQQIEQLKKTGVIRRICALINYRALGKISTLVAAHIPQKELQDVVEAINALANVSHNYLRKHYYNLWFTLQAETSEQIGVTLSNLSGRFGLDFHSLPVRRVFKLDVRFDARQQEQPLLQDVEHIPEDKVVKLSERQGRILSKLQNDLDLISRPFEALCSDDTGPEDVLRIIRELVDKNVVRRIAAVVDHRKLGFAANVLFACEVPQGRVIEIGEKLARFNMVSHCYERGTVEDWPYNLFAMMHARSMGEVQRTLDRFVEAEKIESFELLPTEAELKKQPVKYKM